MDFNFDSNEFEKLVNEEMTAGITDYAADLTRKLDDFRKEYAGHDVASIKPALKQMWEADGGTISDPELTEYAEAISNDTKIEIVFEGDITS